MAFPYKSKIFPRGLIRRNSPRRFFPRTVLDIQITSYMLIHIIVQLNPKTLFLYNRFFYELSKGCSQMWISHMKTYFTINILERRYYYFQRYYIQDEKSYYLFSQIAKHSCSILEPCILCFNL